MVAFGFVLYLFFRLLFAKLILLRAKIEAQHKELYPFADAIHVCAVKEKFDGVYYDLDLDWKVGEVFVNNGVVYAEFIPGFSPPAGVPLSKNLPQKHQPNPQKRKERSPKGPQRKKKRADGEDTETLQAAPSHPESPPAPKDNDQQKKSVGHETSEKAPKHKERHPEQLSNRTGQKGNKATRQSDKHQEAQEPARKTQLIEQRMKPPVTQTPAQKGIRQPLSAFLTH